MAVGYAAIIIRREADLVAHFELMRAISPASALSLESLRVEHNTYFRRLETRAVIRQSPSGLYYLDQRSWEAIKAFRRRTLIIVVTIAAAVAAAAAYTATSRSTPDVVPASVAR